MKCLAVFSTLPDLLFLWCDEQFKCHLIVTAGKNGLSQHPSDFVEDDEELIQSYANHFFAPIVTSNRYMQEMKNSYRSIICDNGFTFCMNEISDLFYVAVCGDGEESELFLQRKIHFFNYLLLLYYGPCAAFHLKPSSVMLRKETWENLMELLITWQILCKQEQMFLVEALERLHVNQQLNSISLNLLGDALLKTNKDGKSVHALLLVNNKLLGLYSNERSPELQVSDILLLIVLVKHKFQYSDETVPNSIYRTPSILNDGNIQLKNDTMLFSCHTENAHAEGLNNVMDNDSILDYQSVPSTPPPAEVFHTPTETKEREEQDKINGNYDECLVAYDITMNEADLEILSSSGENGEIDTKKGDLDENDTNDEQEQANEENVFVEEGYFQQSVFLRIKQCEYAPHIAYCLLLDKATVLIIISQNNDISLAVSIQILLHKLNCILKLTDCKLPSYRVKLHENIVKSVIKINNQFNKNVELHTQETTRSFKIFEQRWENIQKNGFEEFIRSETSAADMPKTLENCIDGFLKCTKAFFTTIFIHQSHKQATKEERKLQILLNVRDMAIRKLNHFNLYLQVRGQRNVTMTAYHNDFPGLVHFVYINRNIDQLITPTINVNSDSNLSYKLHVDDVIKQHIWDMWQYMETMLGQGYTSVIIRDGDFTYSYFLWFEDMLGKPLTTNKSIKEMDGMNPTGIISSNFYKDVIHYLFPNEAEGSIHCYELLCMHIGVVNNHFIATSAQKLAKMLWDASGPIIIL